MKIVSSDISMGASYNKISTTYEKEHLEQWIGSRNPDQSKSDALQLSKKCKELRGEKCSDDFEALDPKLKKIIQALEILTGKKIRVQLFHPEEQKHSVVQEGRRVGWGIDYSYEKTEINSQSLQFASSGKVVLEDGRKIDFKLAFSMENRSVRHESISLKAGDALIDPLVIQFQDGAVEFSNAKTNLDLDFDGIKEEFSFVGSGSGFLTLDKNSDGKVNDGSELFGPNSGDGFTDLREYDQDNNNWIDENDSVFDKLQIWTKDEDGKEAFYSLKDVGIGALYLQSITTPFEFKEGNLAQSSIFLRENGSSGVVNEVDLKV